MGVSPRHTRRILAAYQEKGAATVAHGLRGRKPANATPEPVATAVVHLARTRYAGTNHTHLSELLSDRDGIDIGRTTLRRILVNAGLNSPRRRRQPKHRVRRQRMPRQGMLIQMDGSHHPWLGDRIPPFTLLIAVDDATGTVVDALFCEKEDAHSYFLLIQRLLQRRGIPLALYTDRHGVFRHTPGSGLPGMPTQFSRAMDELAIQMIFALSPQACIDRGHRLHMFGDMGYTIRHGNSVQEDAHAMEGGNCHVSTQRVRRSGAVRGSDHERTVFAQWDQPQDWLQVAETIP